MAGYNTVPRFEEPFRQTDEFGWPLSYDDDQNTVIADRLGIPMS